MSLRQPSPSPRRNFLKSASTVLALAASSYRRVLGANERIGIGFIGCGLMGKRHLADFLLEKDCQVTAVCDVHRGRLEEARAQAGGNAEGYADFRKILDDRTVDAVVVSTPDHWHALQTIMACDAGKDVYVEKPLTLFQREGQWIIEVAQRTGRIIQIGTQQRSGKHYQAVREFLQTGGLGKVHSIRLTSVRNIGLGFAKADDGSPPPELDWEMWLGPAPQRVYNPMRAIYHFRWFWDYSGGQMTNLGAHHLDIVDWVLGLHSLKSISSIGGRFILQDDGETPDTQDTIFDCDQFTINYSIREASRGEPNTNGISFHGTLGQLFLTRSGFRIVGDPDLPADLLIPNREDHPVGAPFQVLLDADTSIAKRQKIESREDRSGDSDEQYREHVRDFLDSIKSRRVPRSDVASAHRTATTCHLANIALRLGRMMRWRFDTEQVIDDAEANQKLERSYRSPWDSELKALGIRS